MERLIEPGRKVMRFPEHVLALQRGQTPMPIHVEMDLTNTCNSKCAWCDFEYTHDGRVLPMDLACSILDQLAEAGVRAVTFTGGGEPTLHPQFEDIARVAKAEGLDLGLYTNGLDMRQLKRVAECFTWIYVSLDAVDPAEYAQGKGVPHGFDRVTANVKCLASMGLPEMRIGVGYLIRDGHARVEQAAVIAKGLGASYVQFRPAVGLSEYGWVAGMVGRLQTLAADPPLPIYYSLERFFDVLAFHRSYSVCRGSALVPCVGASGELWACLNTRGIRSLGNLAEASFRELWQARPVQYVGPDCRVACRNHALNETLEYVCREVEHGNFV